MRARKRKLLRNLLLIALSLVVLWYAEGRPLSGRLAYRAAEQAYFLDRKEIFDTDQSWGVTISRDAKNLYLCRGGTIRQAPFSNGAAWAMAREDETLVFYAVEESGKAVRAELEERLISGLGLPELIYRAEAEEENGVFRLPVAQRYDFDMDGYGRAEIEHFWDIYNKIYYGNLIHGRYELTITFYDERETVIGAIRVSS